jgi:hypothetical protein
LLELLSDVDALQHLPALCVDDLEPVASAPAANRVRRRRHRRARFERLMRSP